MKHPAKPGCARRDGPQKEAPPTPAAKGRPTDKRRRVIRTRRPLMRHAIVTEGRDRDGLGVAPLSRGARRRARSRFSARRHKSWSGCSEIPFRKGCKRSSRESEAFASNPAGTNEMAVPTGSGALGIDRRVKPEDSKRSSQPVDAGIGRVEQFSIGQQMPAVIVEDHIT